jgi:hypothetical protein
MFFVVKIREQALYPSITTPVFTKVIIGNKEPCSFGLNETLDVCWY